MDTSGSVSAAGSTTVALPDVIEPPGVTATWKAPVSSETAVAVPDFWSTPTEADQLTFTVVPALAGDVVPVTGSYEVTVPLTTGLRWSKSVYSRS